MKKIKLFDYKNECCGCNACTQICPQKAIRQVEDSEGFYYPEINRNKCIQCELCQKVCPLKENVEKSDKVKDCYIAYDENLNDRMKSSSGGLFSIFANWIIKNNGIVIGASFDKKWLVHHICVDNINDLVKLKGSKYLQSRIEKTFVETKEYLDNGKKVLFTGVECQISGLKKFLGRDYDNLYTLSVLCHGVPSPKVWKKYLNWQKNMHNSEIYQVSFRTKDNSWKNYEMQILFENGQIYHKEFYHDKYMNLFLGEICLRPSCYNCKFKKLERNADITLGDCWGIENHTPDMDDDKGTSVVFVHSEKGENLWDNIKNELKWKEIDVDKACPPSSDSRKSVTEHINRKKFLKNLRKNVQFEELYECLQISYFGKVKRKIKLLQKSK